MTAWRTLLADFWRTAVSAARLAIGIPDYDNYVAHMRARHPDARVMSYAEFFDERQQQRYGSGRTGCC